ncbi:hypothetical protein IKU74_01760 [bacterium]|nr:hypothetical protein [bacterium]
MKILPINNQYTANRQTFGQNTANEIAPLSKGEKLGIFASAATGVGIASALIARKQGFSLNPKVIFKQSPKEWAMFKIFNKENPNAKLMEIEEKEILMLAGGSAVGGLAGGAIFDDKKHMKSKLRETVSQLLGNVAIPVGCVSLTSRLYRKYKPQILSKVPQIDGSGNTVKYFNKFLKASPSLALTAASLGFGIIAGNKFSNFLNEKVFNKKVERGIKTTDFAPHVDDIGMAVTLMADKSKLSTTITRTVPAFLCVPGYEIGTHRD